jgi:pSer/pThr/pTyr-binding forkhead associated (FHA) protein
MSSECREAVMTECPQCGESWPALAANCPRCGYAGGDATSRIRLGETAAETAATSEGVDLAQLLPGTALLVVPEGAGAGSRFLLDADRTTVGRSEESDILLDDVTVSRRHARFERSETGFRVVDLGSLNGTYVNRTPVETAELADSDEVQIGKYRMVVHFGATGG